MRPLWAPCDDDKDEERSVAAAKLFKASKAARLSVGTCLAFE